MSRGGETVRANTTTRRSRASGREIPYKNNRLLAALSAPDLPGLSAHFELFSLDVRQSIYEPNRPLKYVHFPLHGVISLVTIMRNGTEVEAATIGCEGFVGVPILLGAKTSADRAYCQVPGHSIRLKADVLRKEVEQNGPLRDILQRYTQAMIAQIAQGAACNAVHPLSRRFARWLLQTHDRVGDNRFPLTQEFLSGMLGVRRAGVSEAASRLSKAGLIRYQRGIVQILDRAGLEHASCECYRATQKAFDRFLGPDRRDRECLVMQQ